MIRPGSRLQLPSLFATPGCKPAPAPAFAAVAAKCGGKSLAVMLLPGTWRDRFSSPPAKKTGRCEKNQHSQGCRNKYQGVKNPIAGMQSFSRTGCRWRAAASRRRSLLLLLLLQAFVSVRRRQKGKIPSWYFLPHPVQAPASDLLAGLCRARVLVVLFPCLVPLFNLPVGVTLATSLVSLSTDKLVLFGIRL